MIAFSITNPAVAYWFDLLGQYAETICLKVTPDGLFVNTMDTAHICYIETRISVDAFSHYKVDGEYTLGLDVLALRYFLNLTPKFKEIFFECTDTDMATQPKLHVTISSVMTTKNLNGSVSNLAYDNRLNLDLLDIQATEFARNYEADQKFHFAVKADFFFNTLKKMNVGEAILKIKMDGEQLHLEMLSTKGSSEMVIKAITDDGVIQPISLSCPDDESVTALFSMKLLLLMLPADKLCQTVEAKFEKDSPMSFRIPVEQYEGKEFREVGEFVLHVAPQVLAEN